MAAKKNHRDDALEWLLNAASSVPTPAAKTTQASQGKPPAKATSTSSQPAAKKAKKAPSKSEARAAKNRAQQLMQLAAEEEKRAEARRKSTTPAVDVTARLVEEEEKRKTKERNALLSSIKKEREEEREMLQMKEELRSKKLEAEQKLKDIPSALQHIQSEYGPTRYSHVCATIVKILAKIRKFPEDSKYRKLSLTNEKIQKVVRVVGGLTIMNQLGFQEAEGVLVMPKAPSPSQLEKFIAHFVTASSKIHTCLPQLLNALKPETPLELRFYAVLLLRNVLANVVAGQDDRNFRVVDTQTQNFKRMAKFPEVLKVLTEFGFSPPSQHGIYYEVKSPDLSKFEAGVREVDQILARDYYPSSKLLLHTLNLAENNKGKFVQAAITMAQECIQRVLHNPVDDKYYTIKIAPFAKKVGLSLEGSVELLRLLGFKANEESSTASLSVPKGCETVDTELLKLRSDELNRAWVATKQEMKRRRQEASARSATSKISELKIDS